MFLVGCTEGAATPESMNLLLRADKSMVLGSHGLQKCVAFNADLVPGVQQDFHTILSMIDGLRYFRGANVSD